MIRPASPQVRELLDAARERGDAGPLTIALALRLAQAAAHRCGPGAERRIMLHNVTVCLAAGLTVGILVAGGSLTARTLTHEATTATPAAVGVLGALVVTALAVLAFHTHLPGRLVLRTSLASLGGIRALPVPAMRCRVRLNTLLEAYLRRRLTAGQLETFTVLAPDYPGTIRELIVVSRSLA